MEQTHDSRPNVFGPVRAIAGIKGKQRNEQRRVACSRCITARPLGWRSLL
jgi:hypothetical protein